MGTADPMQIDPLLRVTNGPGTRLVATLCLSGDVDAFTVAALTAAIERVLDDGHTAELVLDLEGVTFAGSAFLTQLVRARRQVPVTLIRASPFLKRLLMVTGLAELVTIR